MVDGLPEGIAVLCDAKFGVTALSRLHDDLYIVPQSDEEAHKALDRISPELACQHRRYLGLIDTHELSRGRLCQTPPPDGPVDLNHQSGLDQMFAGVGQTEVREYVARTGFLSSGFFFSIPHLPSHCLSRCRTRSISGFGVAIPALDFF